MYEEVTLGWAGLLPRFLTSTRVGGIRLFEWLAVLLGLPFFYLLTLLLNKILTPLVRALWRRFARHSDLFDRDVLPAPVRLLILALAIRWFLASLPLPLLVRQFWSNLASLLTVIGIVWLLILLNGEVERYIRRRFPRSNQAAAATLVRVLRRMARFPGDLRGRVGHASPLRRGRSRRRWPDLASAGLPWRSRRRRRSRTSLPARRSSSTRPSGSAISSRWGRCVGTVDHIGLRSTRIRTLDRTIVSVPNSQIANVSLETLSARDKFWFHPVVGVRYETTTAATARRGRGHPTAARGPSLGRPRVGARAVRPPGGVLVRRRGLRVRLRERLEPLSRDPGTTALRV